MVEHTIGDIEEIKKYKYCYLNNIYKGENNIHVFELLLADSYFTKFAMYLTNGGELRQILGCNELVKDFSIVDGVLKFSNTNILPLYDGIKEDLFKVRDISPEKKTLFDLFRQGALNNYIILEDSVVKENDNSYVGSAFTKFTNIRFSNTTMSIYAKMVTEEGLYNKMLVTMKNGYLNASQFYFGVPIVKQNSDKGLEQNSDKDLEQSTTSGIKTMSLFGDSKISDVKFFGEEYCKTMTINGDDYKIYYLRMCLLATKTAIINPFINKAASMCVKFTNICNALEFFISEQYSWIYPDQKKKEWIGGDSNYNDGVGVYFNSSRKTITKKDDAILFDQLCSTIKRCNTTDEVVNWVKNSGFSEDKKQIMLIYLSFMMQSNKPVERVNLAYTYKDKIDLHYVCFSSYAYEMRLRIFNDDSFIIYNQKNPLEPVIVNGSDEKGYTIINKVGNSLG